MFLKERVKEDPDFITSGPCGLGGSAWPINVHEYLFIYQK
jgi:hypothetical protein